MGELNLDELERLAKAATPGPWEWWTSNSFLRLSGPDGRDGGVLYACNIRNEYATVVVSEADLRFIAEARTALPALIARIRELEQDAARYQHVRAHGMPKLCPAGFYYHDGVFYPTADAAIDAYMAAIDAARKQGASHDHT